MAKVTFERVFDLITKLVVFGGLIFAVIIIVRWVVKTLLH